MSKGISLHLGLNHVDSVAYNNWDGALSGCVNDANSMQNIAASCGYATNLLLNDQATSQNLINKITDFSNQLVSGDYFVLTFSCHGGQFTTTVSADEPDGKDETLVLYNRQFVDNELNNLLAKFSSGVKIFVTSDSCHSGTVVRRLPTGGTTPTGAVKAMPEIIGNADYLNRKAEYDSIISASRIKAMINAEIIYISGCQDNQVSYDGNVNGNYTAHLLQVWNNAVFSGGYLDFYNQIRNAMGATQVPNLMQLGIVSNSFLNSKPFIIMPNTTTTTPTNTPTDIASALDILTGSVGDAGTNNLEDVMYIQGLLNDISKLDGGTAENKLGIDGGVGAFTKNAIKKFQQTHSFLPSRLVKPNSMLLLAMLYKAGRF